MQRYHSAKQSEGIEMKWMKILRNKKGKLEPKSGKYRRQAEDMYNMCRCSMLRREGKSCKGVS